MTTASIGKPGIASLRRKMLVSALLLSIVGLLLLAWYWDWNWFRGFVEHRVEVATGRRFDIDGDFSVDPGWRVTTLRAETVRLANADWSQTPQMASADAVEIDVTSSSLLRREWVLPAARLEKPHVLLERLDRNPGNWVFHRRSSNPKRRIRIEQLLVDDGELSIRDAPLRTDLELRVHSTPARREDALAPLAISGSGTYRGFAFKLDGRVESPLELRNRAEPYWVDLDARAGATRALAQGHVSAMGKLDTFTLTTKLSGPDLALLHPLFDVVMPETPPYALKGQMQRDGNTWHYRQISGTVGDSDIAGDATVTFGRERPHLQAALTSTRLDFDDLAGFIGAPPSTDAGETASAAQKKAAAELASSDRVLPQRAYRLDQLRAMDADVTLHARQVDAMPLPLESLRGTLHLERGVARLDPLDLGVAGGHVVSRITLDASKPEIASSADLRLRGLQLPKLFPGIELTEHSVGSIGGRIVLAGRGNSIASMLATSDGDIGVLMGRGRISNLLLELAGLDVAEALRFLLGEDRVVTVRCAFADFEVEEG